MQLGNYFREDVKNLIKLIIAMISCLSMKAWGQFFSNEPLYQDPFDLASGGASLTMATREGLIFSNPALIPFGGKIIRWGGTKFNIMAPRNSLLFAAKASSEGCTATTGAMNGMLGASSACESSGADINSFMGKKSTFGISSTLSLIANNLGASLVIGQGVDLDIRRSGDTATGFGIPQIILRAESANAIAASAATRLPATPFSLGLTAKYMALLDTKISAGLEAITDTSALTTQTNNIRNGIATGIGYDLGFLTFLQGRFLDLRLAATAADIGDSNLNTLGEVCAPTDPDCSAKQPIRFQTLNVGTSITLHTNADMIHFAIDYRDVNNAYAEPLFKRIYAGTKITLLNTLGIAAGVHHGYPSYGIEFDGFLFKFSLNTWQKVLGVDPNGEIRKYFMFSLSSGFSL